jgi:hypothetical protein
MTTITPYYASVPQSKTARLARHFLQMPQSVHQTLNNLEARHPNQHFLMDRLRWLTSKTLDYDVRNFPKASFPGLKRWLGDVTLAQAPMGAMVAWLYFFTFPERMKIARQRQSPDDLTKETFDVAVRDMTAMALLLFVLDPVVRWTNRNIMQRLGGVKLVNHQEIIPYSEMRNIYGVKSPQSLRALMHHPDTQRGFRQAVSELTDRGLGKEGFKALEPAVAQFKTMVEKLTHPDQTGYEDAFAQLKKLDELVQLAKRQGLETGNKRLLDKAFKLSQSYQFENFFAYYANRFRVPADLGAFALVMGLAGWAPLALTNALSKRAVEQYKSQQHPAAASNTANPLQQQGSPIFDRFKTV